MTVGPSRSTRSWCRPSTTRGIDWGATIHHDVLEHVIRPILPGDLDTRAGMNVYVNPSGKFVLGGPARRRRAHRPQDHRRLLRRDGPPRRRLLSRARIPPRWTARPPTPRAGWPSKWSASGAAERCEVQVAYAIGVARPVSVLVETFGTERVDRAKIAKAVDAIFDLRPAAIIRDLDLRRPIYLRTAAYGHFGRGDQSSPGSRHPASTICAGSCRSRSGPRPARCASSPRSGPSIGPSTTW